MTEFLKGYAAGANDMEAGRLVTEVEKWRQYQHKAANEAWKWKAHAEAAEAKLAEVEKERDHAQLQRDAAREACRKYRASMDRARELAEDHVRLSDAPPWVRDWVGAIARLLGGDDEKVEVVPAAFTDEDVERVAEAIRGALADTWTIARETTEAPTEAELDAAARAALSAYLEPTTKGDT